MGESRLHKSRVSSGTQANSAAIEQRKSQPTPFGANWLSSFTGRYLAMRLCVRDGMTNEGVRLIPQRECRS